MSSIENNSVRIHIDQKRCVSATPTTGEALYALGQVSEHHELFREVRGDHEDEAIPRSATNIGLQEDEHFHSGPRELTIFVNGRPKVVTGRKLSFDQVVALAFNPVPVGPNILFTITYERGPHSNPEGSLVKGGVVKIKDGMIFNVTQTDKS
jgi:hypothetical protein